eukprot:TRINITY_DN6981_c0_g1_i1.p1 TRINITY_DN6981_c0_g1~~TRINITY_DN6981_c0_g1_i1.p1  ORF type:complete len:268 (+),score=53.57 TRINITY_DN6981_c0_g1_i1:27-830(+)
MDELKELVTHALEKKGILNKIRAELRLNVFLAIEEQDKKSSTAVKSNPCSALKQTADGRLALDLIRDLFDFCELEHSTSALDAEAGLSSMTTRLDMANKLGLSSAQSSPLLVQLIQRAQQQPFAATTFASSEQTQSLSDTIKHAPRTLPPVVSSTHQPLSSTVTSSAPAAASPAVPAAIEKIDSPEEDLKRLKDIEQRLRSLESKDTSVDKAEQYSIDFTSEEDEDIIEDIEVHSQASSPRDTKVCGREQAKNKFHDVTSLLTFICR